MGDDLPPLTTSHFPSFPHYLFFSIYSSSPSPFCRCSSFPFPTNAAMGQRGALSAPRGRRVKNAFEWTPLGIASLLQVSATAVNKFGGEEGAGASVSSKKV